MARSNIIITTTRMIIILQLNKSEHILSPINETPGLNVRYRVSRHSVASVLLARDDDAQLVRLVLHQPHHLEVLLAQVWSDGSSTACACAPFPPSRSRGRCRTSGNPQRLFLTLAFDTPTGGLLGSNRTQLTCND